MVPAADVARGRTLSGACSSRSPPLPAATAMDTVIQVLSDEPVPPRRLIPTLERDLETICLKCLRREAGQAVRTSAAALAERTSVATSRASQLRRERATCPRARRQVGAHGGRRLPDDRRAR